MTNDSMGHSTFSRVLWMTFTSIAWALTFDVFYNQHHHHGRLMLLIGLSVFGTLNSLVPAHDRRD